MFCAHRLSVNAKLVEILVIYCEFGYFLYLNEYYTDTYIFLVRRGELAAILWQVLTVTHSARATEIRGRTLVLNSQAPRSVSSVIY